MLRTEIDSVDRSFKGGLVFIRGCTDKDPRGIVLFAQLYPYASMAHKKSDKEADAHGNTSQIYHPYARIFSHLESGIFNAPVIDKLDPVSVGQLPCLRMPFQYPSGKQARCPFREFDQQGRVVHHVRISDCVSVFVELQGGTEVQYFSRDRGIGYLERVS